MPQYLSTTQPEALLLLRRLDGYASSNRNIHHQRPPQPNGSQSVGRDERRLWRHRSPNTSPQSLRFEEAQRRVKRVEDFKQAQTAFARVMPLRCWSGRLPIARFYRDDYMTSPTTFKRSMSPVATDFGNTDDDDDDDPMTLLTCASCRSRFPESQVDPGRTSSLNGQSGVTQIPRNLTARRQVGADEFLQPLGPDAALAGDEVAEAEEDAFGADGRVRDRILAGSSSPPPPPDHHRISAPTLESREAAKQTNG